jgi:hypothetical protein
VTDCLKILLTRGHEHVEIPIYTQLKENKTMQWSVIYSFDIKADASLDRYNPQQGEWYQTEGDDCFEIPDVEEGQHRKFVAYLSDQDFHSFVDNVLYPYHVENTMGMLGGMTQEGMSLGLMPAWSLSSDCWDDNLYWQNAYVCPFPENDAEHHFLISRSESEIANWIKEEYVT